MKKVLCVAMIGLFTAMAASAASVPASLKSKIASDDQLATVIRERMRVEGKIRSLTAQGRLQAAIVGFMPLLLATAMYFISPAMMTGFLFSTVGVMIIVTALLFEIVGYLIIRKIVNIDI